MGDSRVEVLVRAVTALNSGEIDLAKRAIEEGYPFAPVERGKRGYTVRQMVEQFFKDGFIDRYSGERLVNPGVLRAISEMIPDVFPYQAHWKTGECHLAYWNDHPTIDHIYPLSLGGEDGPENWATTSMMRNSLKGNFTLEQMGWMLQERGNIREWDGLSKVFVELIEREKALLQVGRIRSYYMATKEMVKRYDL
ncbi:HNH endonuclease [bacterium 210820-DFI.6.52]|nr:HNH endonuclease [bacterium 210820-DFI.6.52]